MKEKVVDLCFVGIIRKLVRDGKSVEEIISETGISHDSVEWYVCMEKEVMRFEAVVESLMLLADDEKSTKDPNQDPMRTSEEKTNLLSLPTPAMHGYEGENVPDRNIVCTVCGTCITHADAMEHPHDNVRWVLCDQCRGEIERCSDTDSKVIALVREIRKIIISTIRETAVAVFLVRFYNTTIRYYLCTTAICHSCGGRNPDAESYNRKYYYNG